MKPLPPMQQRFVDEYIIDLNATAAARRAGYSVRTAEQQGGRLLKNVWVAQAIHTALEARSKRTQIDADWVLRRLAGEAEADLADLYDDAGNLLPIREWPRVFRCGLVVGFETVHETEGSGEDRRRLLVRKVKLQDRSKTIELIGRHVDVQAWRDRVEQAITVSLAQELAGLNAAAGRDVARDE